MVGTDFPPKESFLVSSCIHVLNIDKYEKEVIEKDIVHGTSNKKICKKNKQMFLKNNWIDTYM